MVSVERVLPWRRVETARAPEVGPLVAPFKGRQAKAEAALVTRAYGLAASKHAGQVRRSGEAYLSHPLAVARIVAEQTQDPVAIAAALLHDVVEDTDLSLDDLRRQFPPAVAEIVDGVTKVERTLFATKEAQQAATMRKLVIAMADDLRVLIIKLADRLHNMRTLAAMPVEKQQAIARETFDVYAPLALRLGMDDVRMQLEDLAFAALHPKWYAEIDQMVWNRTPEREVYLTQVAEEVRMRLEDVGIIAEVTGPPQAPLVDLREDGHQGPRVQRDLRPGGHAGRGRARSRTATPRWARSTRCGCRCRAGSRTTSPCPSTTPTSRCTRRWWGRRASSSRCRSAPGRWTCGPASAWPPTGATRPSPTSSSGSTA